MIPQGRVHPAGPHRPGGCDWTLAGRWGAGFPDFQLVHCALMASLAEVAVRAVSPYMLHLRNVNGFWTYFSLLTLSRVKKKSRVNWKLRGVHMKSQPVTGMRYWRKLLKLRVCVLSLLPANIKSFLLCLPNNPHVSCADVPCLPNIQSTKRYQ